MLSCNTGAAAFLLTIGALFTALAAICFILLIRVHRFYRSSGASFSKAQEEFAQGIVSNKTVRQAASGVASAAAQQAVHQYTEPGDSRY